MKHENMMVRLTLVVASDRARGNGSKLEHRTPENTFYSDRQEGWDRFFRDLWSPPTWNVENLKHLGLGGPVWAGELDQMASRDPVQLRPFCDSVEVLYFVQTNALQQPQTLLL